MKIVFMGTPDFASEVLKELVSKGFDISGVFSQKDKPQGRGKTVQPTPVKKFCQEKNIKIFQYTSINKGEGFETLKALKPDIIITAAFGKILKQNVIDLPPMGCWNIHASILPKYRGAAPIQRAILNGEKETGISIFRIVEQLDAGPVALVKKVEIADNDNFSTVFEKLLKASKEAIVEFLENKDSYCLVEQEDNFSYAEKITEKDLLLDFNKSAFEVHNTIRAFDPYPGARCQLGGQMVKVFSSSLTGIKTSSAPGTVCLTNKESFFVACSDEMIKIGAIQYPGKKIITAKDAINGRKVLIGEIFKKVREDVEND